MAWALAAAAAVAAIARGPVSIAQDAAPRLAVIIVIDQMRADYVDRFQRDWTGGLKRMVTQGAWFTNAAYPYLNTVTCAGHATIATGSFPHKHGVLQNAWWDRDARKQMTCTEDPRASDIFYGGQGPKTTAGDSGYRLQVPTFADRMRTDRHAHVVSVSLKDRSAIMLAGHGGDAVAWMTETPDVWATSSTFATAPVPAVKSFLDADPMTRDYGKTWSLTLPRARYAGADDGRGEAPPPGWTSTFPHQLTGTRPEPDGSFVVQWEASPFGDAYLGRFAADLVDALQLGRHEGTDVLAVSFSSPDRVGHAFGPDSWEIHDTYARIDRTIGSLFDRLDRGVGRGRWVAALTADHGVTSIPEQLKAAGKDAGRMSTSSIVNAVEDVLRPKLGSGRHVALASGNDLYFEPGVYDALHASPPLLDAVVAAASAVPGVQKVFRSEEIRDAAAARDPLTRAAALGYVLGRSGDLVIAPKPGWMFSGVGTTHGSATPDDQRVPILFLGRGVRPGRVDQPATPADVAPTLAAICGISMPDAEGRALTSAFVSRSQ
jgi:type I phosphodiesterase/nucleotide pyrophosphatase